MRWLERRPGLEPLGPGGAIYHKERLFTAMQVARTGETREQAWKRFLRDWAALQQSPFFLLWASAAIDEILSALWIANIAEDNVSILEVGSRRILGTIATGKGPTGLAFSRDGRFAYVSNQGDKTVAVVDTASLVVVKRIPVGTNPHFLILGPDGRIWGCNTGSNDVYAIDPGTQDVVGSFQVGPAPQQIAFGYRGLQGSLAYVTVAGFNKVLVLGGDAASLRLMEEIDVGDGPNGIWANAQGTRLFVVHERSNELWVIDTGTSRVIARVPVGRKPIRVVVSK